MIGEEGSYYQAEMMLTYFGMSEMNYEEAYAEYDQTIKSDKVTGGCTCYSRKITLRQII